MNLGTRLLDASNSSVSILKKHGPLILTGASIGLGFASTAMAVKVTPQACDIYNQIMACEELDDKEKRIEIVKNVVPLYLPAAIVGVASAGTCIASWSIQHHRLMTAYEQLAGTAAACLLAKEELKDYKEAIAEKFGEKVEEEIEKEVLEKEAEKRTDHEEIIISNDGPEEIMQDSISGQYFKNTRDRIYFIFNDIQLRLQIEDRIPSSEYFYEADISNCNLGDECGWLCGDAPWPKFTDFVLPDGRKAVRVDVDTNPKFASYNNYY